MNDYANVAKNEVLFIMRHDISRYSDNIHTFISDNYTTYNVALNTWLRIVDDSCGLRAVRSLKGNLLAKGLISTVTDCCNTANALIRGDTDFIIPDFCREMICDDERITLQCLRYLKRFTPVNAVKLNADSIAAFLDLNLSLRTPPAVITAEGKVLERQPVGPLWLLNAVRDKCAEIVGDFECDYDHAGFSNGVTADCDKILLHKLVKLASARPNFFDSPLYPLSTDYSDIDINKEVVKLIPVPKNLERSRIIAALPTVCAYFQQSVRYCLEQACRHTELGARIHLDKQSFNQELCFLGSVYNVYATIDLTGASDSISDPLAKYVLPKEVYTEIDRWNPRWLLYHGKKYRRYTFQTSGNATTFIAETIIFLAICLVATDYYELYTGYTALKPLSYGDDMICDVGVYDTLTDFLEMLGFTVNLEKSFGSESDYRESCGSEYRNGINLKTAYYPRKPIGPDDNESLASLISLQHSIFSFVSAETWLTTYLRQRFNGIGKGLVLTSSSIGEDCGDIWDYTPIYTTLNAPYDHNRMDHCSFKREAHLTLQAKYPVAQLTEYEEHVLTLYYYTKWLRDGAPLIEEGDTLSANMAKLYHWTQSIVMRDRDSGLPEFDWKLTKR